MGVTDDDSSDRTGEFESAAPGREASDGAETQTSAALGAPSPEIAFPKQHPVVMYTLLRLAILLAVGAVLYLLGLRELWLILLSFLVSGAISAFVLSRRREGAAFGITAAFRSVNARIDASARAEDEDDDLEELPAPPAAEPERPTSA